MPMKPTEEATLGRPEDFGESLDILLVERTPPVMLEGQGVAVFGEAKRDGAGVCIKRILDQFEKVDPTMVEGQIEHAQ